MSIQVAWTLLRGVETVALHRSGKGQRTIQCGKSLGIYRHVNEVS
jgi:hypothetical protein